MAFNFNKSKGSAPTGGTKAKPKGKKNLWAGAKSAKPKTPQANIGEYIFEIVDIEDGFNEQKRTSSFKVTLQVVEVGSETCTPVGQKVFVGWVYDGGEVAQYNIDRITAFVRAGAGFDSDEAFFEAIEMDEDGERMLLFVQACMGEANVFTEGGSRPLLGRKIACEVSRGKDVLNDDGKVIDFYREYEWQAVPDGADA